MLSSRTERLPGDALTRRPPRPPTATRALPALHLSKVHGSGKYDRNPMLMLRCGGARARRRALGEFASSHIRRRRLLVVAAHVSASY